MKDCPYTMANKMIHHVIAKLVGMLTEIIIKDMMFRIIQAIPKTYSM